MRRRHATWLAAVAIAIACVACEQLAGVRELTFATMIVPIEASTESGVDAGVDAPPVGCGDLLTDPLNCGECSRRCETGGCSGGRCEPFLVVRDSPGAISLTHEPAFLYWAIGGPDGFIHGVRKDLPDQEFAPQNIDNRPYPHALTYRGGYLFWAEGTAATPSYSSIQRCFGTAMSFGCFGVGPTIATLQRNVTSLYVENPMSDIAWNDESDPDGAVYLQSMLSHARLTIASNLHAPTMIAMDTGGIYFTVREGLAWCPRTGCTGAPEVANVGAPAAKLALDGGYVYVATTGPSGQIWRVRAINAITTKFGEPAVLVADDQPQITALAAAGGAAYWATRGTMDGDGKILRATGTGRALVLAANQDDPTGAVVDEKAVFWITRGTKAGESRIFRVVR